MTIKGCFLQIQVYNLLSLEEILVEKVGNIRNRIVFHTFQFFIEIPPL